MGTGHVMRCLTFAEELAKDRNRIVFICKRCEGNLISFLEQKGYEVFHILQSHSSDYDDNDWLIDALETINHLKGIGLIDWLVVDHYALDKRWEELVYSYTKKIMVIDDLANREHECDMLLDQNYYIDANSRYKNLVPLSCKLLLGPKYALLRNEFRNMRRKSRYNQRSSIQRIFICFGGSDPTNETGKVLDAIQYLRCNHLVFDVVVGIANQYKDDIKMICEKHSHIHFVYNVDNISHFMSIADLCIVSGGTITWERYCLGLVGSIITTAKNQELLAQTMHALQIDYYIDKSREVSEKGLATQIESMINTPIDHLMYRRALAMNLVDGNGVKRVIKAMNDLS